MVSARAFMNFKTAKARLPRRSQPWDERTMNRSARTRARVEPTKASRQLTLRRRSPIKGGRQKRWSPNNLAMYEIVVGEHSDFRIPFLAFRGTPTGIDVLKFCFWRTPFHPIGEQPRNLLDQSPADGALATR